MKGREPWRWFRELISGIMGHQAAFPFGNKKSIMLFPYSRPYENIIHDLFLNSIFICDLHSLDSSQNKERPRKLQNAFSLTPASQEPECFHFSRNRVLPPDLFHVDTRIPGLRKMERERMKTLHWLWVFFIGQRHSNDENSHSFLIYFISSEKPSPLAIIRSVSV